MKTINEILNNCTKKDFIVDSLMKSNGLYCLVARPKVGKSLLALQLTHAIATGTIFLGFKVNPSPALYISTEMDSSQIADRIKKMNLDFNNNFYLIEQELNKKKLNLDDLEEKISEFANINQDKFVIIDMFNGVYINDKFDLYNYQNMAQIVLPKYRKLCSKYGITILLLHHLNKTNTTLGSTAIDTCVDGKIAFKQDENIKSTFYLKYESRDYPSKDYILKRNNNLILSIDEDTEDKLNDNLIQFLKYAIKKEEFTFKISEMVSKLNLNITPPVFGKLLANNKQELEKIGLTIKARRTATDTIYTAIYKEPILESNSFEEK